MRPIQSPTLLPRRAFLPYLIKSTLIYPTLNPIYPIITLPESSLPLNPIYFISNAANPITDALAKEGILRAARSLRAAVANGQGNTTYPPSLLPTPNPLSCPYNAISTLPPTTITLPLSTPYEPQWPTGKVNNPPPYLCNTAPTLPPVSAPLF